MRHVARLAARGGCVVLFCIPIAALGCAAPEELELLLEEQHALRQQAWDAQRQASRALAYAEVAERGAEEALGSAEHAELLAAELRPREFSAVGPLTKADRLRLLKSERRLELYREDELLREFRVALGFEPVGHKLQQGDGRTPEGRYVLGRHHTRRYGPALHISYPRDEDARRASEAGASPGGGIFIHGLPVGLGTIGSVHAKFDWTNGCVAVTDEELEEILARVEDGTPIEILP